MSSDNPTNPALNRRGSVTSAAFSNLFQRSNSTSAGNSNGREAAASAAARDQRRRLSVTTLGLSGTSPQSASSSFGMRRGSISTTTSDSIDETAVDDDESAKATPSTPFARRMSYGAQAMRSMRPGPVSPGQNDNAYNWSEQLRSRAESSVSGNRPTFGSAGSAIAAPRGSVNGGQQHHDRARSVSDMPAPPQQAAAMKPKQPERQKPDHFQERILKGDFYMD